MTIFALCYLFSFDIICFYFRILLCYDLHFFIFMLYIFPSFPQVCIYYNIILLFYKYIFIPSCGKVYNPPLPLALNIFCYTEVMKKNSLLRRWLIASLLIWAIAFLILAFFAFQSDLRLARGNSYTTEHFLETYLFTLKQLIGISFFCALLFGQPAFWIVHSIAAANTKLRQKALPNKEHKPLPIILIVLLTIPIGIAIMFLTAPFWINIALGH